MIDETMFNELNAVMEEELAIAKAQAELDERSKNNRSRLLTVQEAWTNDGKSFLPGVTLSNRSTVKTDYAAALNWILSNPERMLATASVLTVDPKARFVIVQRATQSEGEYLKDLLALDKTAYDGAMREGAFKLMEGLPPCEIETKAVISVKDNAVKTGNELRKALGLPEVAAPASTSPEQDDKDVF